MIAGLPYLFYWTYTGLSGGHNCVVKKHASMHVISDLVLLHGTSGKGFSTMAQDQPVPCVCMCVSACSRTHTHTYIIQ